MESINASQAMILGKAQEIQDVKNNIPVVILEDKADTFEKKSKLPSSGQLVAATLAAGGASTGIYATACKVPGILEKGIKTIANDFGKEIAELPQVAKASIKYGVLVAGVAGAFALALKDSDNDGKLDVFEAIQKFFKPGV